MEELLSVLGIAILPLAYEAGVRVEQALVLLLDEREGRAELLDVGQQGGLAPLPMRHQTRGRGVKGQRRRKRGTASGTGRESGGRWMGSSVHRQLWLLEEVSDVLLLQRILRLDGGELTSQLLHPPLELGLVVGEGGGGGLVVMLDVAGCVVGLWLVARRSLRPT